MRIYVDSNSVFLGSGAQINTNVTMSAGGHNMSVQAWDSAGAVYKTALTVNVSGSSSSSYQNNIIGSSNWIARAEVAPDGAILYSSGEIIPYYSNLAAIGLTRYPTAANITIVENWMKWYINHLNWPDKYGLFGTMYDWNYDHGALSPKGTMDSTDSYAATFLSLAWSYYSTGNAAAQSYVKTLSSQLDAIGQVLIKTSDTDGLTWALPNYHIKYLMDNSEAYRGLRDLASLWQVAFNDVAKADSYNAAATKMQNALQAYYLGGGKWAYYKDDLGRFPAPNLGIWYPDVNAQWFPVMQGVIPPSDSRAIATWNTFNNTWPGWPELSFNNQDPFPWVMMAATAAEMNDSARVNTYIKTITSKYIDRGYPWPWFGREAGWFIRLNAYLLGERPL